MCECCATDVCMCMCVCLSRATGSAACIQIQMPPGSQHVAQHLCFCFASPCLDSPLVALIRFVSIRLHSTGQLHTCKKVKPFQQKFTQLASPTPNEHSDWGRIRNLSNSYLKQEQGGTESMGCGDKLSSQPDDGCICMCLHLVVFDLHSRLKLRGGRGLPPHTQINANCWGNQHASSSTNPLEAVGALNAFHVGY